MLGILNYGMGNLLSIKNMLDYLGIEAVIVNNPKELLKASRLILPGIGSFDNAMSKLKQIGFTDALNELVVNQGRPCLGICLGMQLLFESSEEGCQKGLSWIPGRVMKFNFGEKKNSLKIPHMGWNTVIPIRDSILFNKESDEQRYYFVHSVITLSMFLELHNMAMSLLQQLSLIIYWEYNSIQKRAISLACLSFGNLRSVNVNYKSNSNIAS